MNINKKIAKFINYYKKDSKFRQFLRRFEDKISSCCTCSSLIKSNYPDFGRAFYCWELNHFIDVLNGTESYIFGTQKVNLMKLGLNARNKNYIFSLI